MNRFIADLKAYWRGEGRPSAEVKELRDKLAAANKQLAELQNERSEAAKQFGNLEGRIKTLEDQKLTWADSPEKMKQIALGRRIDELRKASVYVPAATVFATNFLSGKSNTGGGSATELFGFSFATSEIVTLSGLVAGFVAFVVLQGGAAIYSDILTYPNSEKRKKFVEKFPSFLKVIGSLLLILGIVLGSWMGKFVVVDPAVVDPPVRDVAVPMPMCEHGVDKDRCVPIQRSSP